MTQIRHISTSTIQPTIENDHLARRIQLTPCDLQLIRIYYNQKGLLFHKPADQEQSNNLVQHLKASLSRTLNIFYPLAGRLAPIENEDNNTTCFFINCNGAGAQFVHATADCVKVADILDPLCIPDEIVYHLFPLNAVRNYEGISKPLLAAQVTQLVDGIFIGCSINHAVVDGTSFWHFFNTWSEISRAGSNNISQPPPFFGRQFFDSVIDLPVQLPFSYGEITRKHVRRSSESLQRVLFHFSKQKVAELKSKANAEIGINNISSLQALMAHLWRAATRSRHLNPDQEVIYRVMVGLRQRLKPPLPEEYLGNAVKAVLVKSTAGELLHHGLGWAALQINEQIASLTADEARKSLDEWVKTPIFVSNISNISTSSALLTGSSPRFNVFGNDFGWGRPLAVRSGAADKTNGRLTVFPGAEEGSIDVEACLFPEALQAMKDDKEFMEVVLHQGWSIDFEGPGKNKS
ncbi:HXXXD-type acyl-transferase family protein [Prunus dulcis]|uniref:HXXXD-type acyl-transferase family protein n=1 Tax=Prunus dulcis TaxID=3755 RepID=A0A4Y1RVJ2_PRUDU|nr:uncharacterized acetyltransferase At3g50280-like [Prunus dulcis]KAI5319287.1 hypothetical protein L3X38_038995 [Prunus dulcis]BBH07783.1 HXXXD-type acyl-transferase family protein [Prunus dulcis]